MHTRVTQTQVDIIKNIFRSAKVTTYSNGQVVFRLGLSDYKLSEFISACSEASIDPDTVVIEADYEEAHYGCCSGGTRGFFNLIF